MQYPQKATSAIPVFLFLGLILILVPLVIWVLNCIRKRHNAKKSDLAKAEAGEASIELGDLQVPPPAPQVPAPTVAPIRGMSTRRDDNNNHSLQGADLGVRDFAYQQPHAPETVRITDGPFTASPPLSPRYNLHSALESETSPAAVRAGRERRTSITDAPRVKSQRANPSHASSGPGPEVPTVPVVPDANYTAWYHAHGTQDKWM